MMTTIGIKEELRKKLDNGKKPDKTNHLQNGFTIGSTHISWN